MLKSKNELIVLGFDFGLKHIGIAVGQSVTKTAQPLTSLRAYHGEPRWEDIEVLVNTWQPNIFVVGLPLNMDGTSQFITDKAKEFANSLQQRYDLPIYTIDERLSTVEAKDQLFTKHGFKGLNKKNIDSFAAKLIVEDWLKQIKDDNE